MTSKTRFTPLNKQTIPRLEPHCVKIGEECESSLRKCCESERSQLDGFYDFFVVD